MAKLETGINASNAPQSNDLASASFQFSSKLSNLVARAITGQFKASTSTEHEDLLACPEHQKYLANEKPVFEKLTRHPGGRESFPQVLSQTTGEAGNKVTIITNPNKGVLSLHADDSIQLAADKPKIEAINGEVVKVALAEKIDTDSPAYYTVIGRSGNKIISQHAHYGSAA